MSFPHALGGNLAVVDPRLSSKEEQKYNDKGLGPDMSLYGARMTEIKETERLRKENLSSKNTASKLTQAEKEEKAREM